MKHMTKNTAILVAICCLVWLSGFCASAATVPAGITLAVTTLQTISSQDRVGRNFAASLDKDLAVKGKVLLRAGTRFSGKVVASPTNPRRTNPLTVSLNAVSVNGQDVRIKTSEFEVQNEAWKTRRGIRVEGSRFTVPVGSKMAFQLVEPLKL